MSLTILNADELASLEHRAANQLGESTLMNRAGAAAARLISERLPHTASVTVLVGPGNNGGDALALACELKAADRDVIVVLPGGRQPTSALALAQLKRWTELGGEVAEDPYMTRKADCVVDGLFGIGLKKAIQGDYLDAVLWFNERQALKISLDVPSGLDFQTGNWVGLPGCHADITLTFLATKAGLYMNEGADAAGEIVVDSLDVSIPLSNLSVIGADEIQHVVRPRLRHSHKGNYGHVAVVGGQTGMIGATLLAARVALTSGAGRVTVFPLSDAAPSVDMLYPELMFNHVSARFEEASVIVIGCGLGQSTEAKALVQRALASDKPVVFDADALNVIASDVKLQDQLLARQAPSVLTPHPGEAAKLLRRETAGVNVDRVAACRELATQSGAIVVLKGVGSVVSLRSARAWINPTGTPALATAGSGDVLAGMIAAMFAQGYDMVEAVHAGVYLHGLASEGIEAGMTASDIAPNAMAILQDARVNGTLLNRDACFI